jgi:hypothetical protein
MKRILLYLLLFFSKIAFTQQAKIQEHFPSDGDTIYKITLLCDKNAGEGGRNYCDINMLDSNLLEIFIHSPMPAYGGSWLKILLDSNINIKNLSYQSWDDMPPMGETTYVIENPSLVLNLNPFEKGINGLEGIYNFNLKSIYEPSERGIELGRKKNVYYQLLRGKFKCCRE